MLGGWLFASCDLSYYDGVNLSQNNYKPSWTHEKLHCKWKQIGPAVSKILRHTQTDRHLVTKCKD